MASTIFWFKAARKSHNEDDSSFGRTTPAEGDADAGPGAEEGGLEGGLRKGQATGAVMWIRAEVVVRLPRPYVTGWRVERAGRGRGLVRRMMRPGRSRKPV